MMQSEAKYIKNNFDFQWFSTALVISDHTFLIHTVLSHFFESHFFESHCLVQQSQSRKYIQKSKLNLSQKDAQKRNSSGVLLKGNQLSSR